MITNVAKTGIRVVDRQRAVGVYIELMPEPTDQPGGVMGTFNDVDGNEFVLREGS